MMIIKAAQIKRGTSVVKLSSPAADDHATAENARTVDLSKFDNAWYNPGPPLKRILWYACGLCFVQTRWPFPSKLKRMLLAAFGAKLGRGVVIKPNVNIKYPWLLEIGNDVWIGEGVWIDNLAKVTIGSNVCVSQGAYLLTGNHDYKAEAFDLIVGPIVVEDGAWVGAKAIVCPGATLKTHAVLTAGSVLSKTAEAWTIYAGNPAAPVRKRQIS